MRLSNKKILLGITGSIAAYKAAVLTRSLIKEGAEVKVIMTPGSMEFVTPLTLSTLSKNEIISTMATDLQWNNHVELGLWADAYLIAPCTANTIGKFSVGLADNMLVASYLSAKCPVFIAPAMDLDMWKHGSTRENLKKLESFGDMIIPVEFGELASGLIGDGRMAEPATIVDFLAEHFNKKKDLKGKKILITAGPTHEAIDPVRFIGNNSSGKMGIALAEECAGRGANVKLILGPVSIPVNDNNIAIVPVKSATEMFEASIDHYPNTDIAILAAAVADYTPLYPSAQKIKKSDKGKFIELTRTKDIASELGRLKTKKQINIGFALETENEIENALSKLEKKNFDFIVLNSMRDKGAGFQYDTNQISIVYDKKKIIEFGLKSKKKVAWDIVNEVTQLF